MLIETKFSKNQQIDSYHSTKMNNTKHVPVHTSSTNQLASCAKTFQSFRNENRFFTSNKPIQFAGNYINKMPKHDATNPEKTITIISNTKKPNLNKTHSISNWTYHHIIPENLWNQVYHILIEDLILKKDELIKTPSVLNFLSAGRNWSIEAQLMDHTYKINKCIDPYKIDIQFLQNKIKDKNKSTPYIEKKEIVKQLKLLHRSNISQKKKMTLDDVNNEKENLEFYINKLNQTYKNDKITLEPNDFTGYDDELHARMCWIVGNLHQGPSCEIRLSPGDVGYDQERDDGGNNFETSASKVINGEHYKKLETLNSYLRNVVIEYSTMKKSQKRDLITKMFDLMTELMSSKYFTPFNKKTASKWGYDEETNRARFY